MRCATTTLLGLIGGRQRNRTPKCYLSPGFESGRRPYSGTFHEGLAERTGVEPARLSHSSAFQADAVASCRLASPGEIETPFAEGEGIEPSPDSHPDYDLASRCLTTRPSLHIQMWSDSLFTARSVAPRAGLEPAAIRLEAERSSIELPGHIPQSQPSPGGLGSPRRR
jgi:hypothetical protein